MHWPTGHNSKKFVGSTPKWLVANWSSMLSWESLNGLAITPALLLPTRKTSCYLFS